MKALAARFSKVEQLVEDIGNVVNHNVDKSNKRHKELVESIDTRFGLILAEINEIKHGIAKKAAQDEKLLKVR